MDKKLTKLTKKTLFSYYDFSKNDIEIKNIEMLNNEKTKCRFFYEIKREEKTKECVGIFEIKDDEILLSSSNDYLESMVAHLKVIKELIDNKTINKEYTIIYYKNIYVCKSSLKDIQSFFKKLDFIEKYKYKFIDELKSIEDYIKIDLEGKAENTKRGYKHAIVLFLEFLFFEFNKEFPSFQEHEINEFIKELEEGGKKNTYINQMYHAILSYANYKDIVIKKKKIRLPKLPDILTLEPKALEQEDFSKLEGSLMFALEKAIEKAYKKEETLSSALLSNRESKLRDVYRNYVAFKLMSVTGMRINEAIGLDFDDINFKENYIHIKKSKNMTERYIPVPSDVMDLLKEYIKFRKDKDKDIEKTKLEVKIYGSDILKEDLSKAIDEYLDNKSIQKIREQIEEIKADREIDKQSKKFQIGLLLMSIRSEYVVAAIKYVDATFVQNTALFISNRYRRVSDKTIMRVFRELDDEIDFTSHQLRHTYIKTLVDNNVSLNKVTKLSGHRNMNMIARYSTPTRRELSNTVENLFNFSKKEDIKNPGTEE